MRGVVHDKVGEEGRARPCGPGNHIHYFNFYSKVRGVSQKGIKQKSEMDCVHMITFVF